MTFFKFVVDSIYNLHTRSKSVQYGGLLSGLEQSVKEVNKLTLTLQRV